jgi:serine protease Do
MSTPLPHRSYAFLRTFLGLFLLSSLSVAIVPEAAAKAKTRSRVEVVQAAMPAVVNISTTRRARGLPAPMHPFFSDPMFREFFGDEFFRRFPPPSEQRELSLGSGVIVKPNGYIVTNYHVVAQAEEIKVLLDSPRREFTAKLVGSDPKTDLAIIKIDAQKLSTLPWGDSDKLQVGEDVLAIGSPFALSQTVTAGIVSAVGRANVGIADYEDFIQTDAAINPGNSGGALINSKGELVGINTAIFSRTGGYIGIGFAVPSNMVRDVMHSLMTIGKVVRGWLGVSIQPVTPELAKQFQLPDTSGVLVSDVVAGSPAARAGIATGDVVLAYNDKPIDSPGLLRNLVASTEVGSEVKLTLLRDGERRTVGVRIDEQPKEARAEGQPQAPGEESGGLAGVEVRDLTPEISQQLGLPPQMQGVVISGLDPSSAAAEAGLQPGDAITQINRQPVRNVGDYRRVLAALGEDQDVLLLMNRAGNQQFAVVQRQPRSAP